MIIQSKSNSKAGCEAGLTEKPKSDRVVRGEAYAPRRILSDFFVSEEMKMTEEKQNREKNEISKQEAKILDFVRSVDYGEIRIVINGGKPVRVEEIRKSIML